MRTYLLAALAVLSLGMLDLPSARADWREGFTGNPVFRNDITTARPYVLPTSAVRTAVASAPKRKASNKKPAGVVQKTSLTSTGAWAGSVGSIQTGIASFYWQPQRVASGGWFNPNAMTAAHRTLPFGTKVEVTNLSNGKSVTVTINDRGPFIQGRIIDLSLAAAGVIGMKNAGLARVNVAVIGR